MKTLEDEVRLVIQDFMQNDQLFTALDVSNKVKLTMPLSRHREVRDLVRAEFAVSIEPNGWSRTPINVTLADNSVVEALLYHSLNDIWDLDNKYDLQKRSQTSAKWAPSVSATPVVPATVSSAGKAVTTPVTVSVPTTVSPQHQWAQLFNSQPSLFPLK